MKPENIKKLINEWKAGVKQLDKSAKSSAGESAYFTAASLFYEARTMETCISELEHAIKQ